MSTANSQLSEALPRLAAKPDDQEAWAQLYRATWPFVRGITHRLFGGDSEKAEDAGQEVFLRVAKYCNFNHLKDPEAFRRYVWTITLNVVRSEIRHSRREASVLQGKALIEAARIPRLTQSDLELKELLSEISGALDEPSMQIVILLSEGCSMSEVVEITGLTYGNAAVRLHRLRRRLLKYWDEKSKL